MSMIRTKKALPAEHFALLLSKNVENKKLSDKDFRDFVRNTLPIVNYSQPDSDTRNEK